MRNTKISVITINYNNRDGLQRTIASVVNQDTDSFEYIVIDGGSTDGSAEIIKANEDKIDYWCSETDKGIYNAMNKGVIHATGEFCIFMNSGDVFYNCNVLNMLITREIISEYDFISGNMLFSKSGEIIKNRIWSVPNKMDSSILFFGNLPHQATFIRRSLLIENPYDETKKIASDWKQMFICIVLKNARYKKIEDFVVSIYDVDGISWGINDDERLQSFRELFPPLLAEEIISEIQQRRRIYNFKTNHPRLYKRMIESFLLMSKFKVRIFGGFIRK